MAETTDDRGGSPPIAAEAAGGQAHSSWTKQFDDAAEALLAEIGRARPRPKKMHALAIATFAAFEARRQLSHSDSRSIDRFYAVFLIATVLSPILVVIAPREAQGVVWDCVGIGSTMLLLYFTYGIYTLKMAGRAAQAIISMVSDPANWKQVVFTGPASEPREGGELEAIVAVGLLLGGTVIAGFAFDNLWSLYKIAVTTHDKVEYAATYVRYFVAVLLLSVLFIIMDVSVAAFNESHAETYVAASSAAHTTFPMCAGITLVGVYLLAQYIRAIVLGEPEPVGQLSVDFASGALTFQMIVSNVLFILIKKNFVFRLFYNTVETTKKP